MKRKLMIVSILAILMLVAISFSTAVSSDTTTEKKESPLYKIRARMTIGERLDDLRENIETRFINRAFFLPWLIIEDEYSIREQLGDKEGELSFFNCYTAAIPPCITIRSISLRFCGLSSCDSPCDY